MSRNDRFLERVLLLGGTALAGDEEEAFRGVVFFKRCKVGAAWGRLPRLHFDLTECQSRFELILAEKEWHAGRIAARASYLSFVPLENFGFSIVPSIRNGKDNLPSINLAPAKRANVFVQKPCLVVMVATP